MANQRNGTLYVGVTSNLAKRIWEHKSGVIKGFTEKYNVKQLAHYGAHTDIYEAIKHKIMEKRLETPSD